jgi:hypothetical protein
MKVASYKCVVHTSEFASEFVGNLQGICTFQAPNLYLALTCKFPHFAIFPFFINCSGEGDPLLPVMCVSPTLTLAYIPKIGIDKSGNTMRM